MIGHPLFLSTKHPFSQSSLVRSAPPTSFLLTHSSYGRCALKGGDIPTAPHPSAIPCAPRNRSRAPWLVAGHGSPPPSTAASGSSCTSGDHPSDSPTETRLLHRGIRPSGQRIHGEMISRGVNRRAATVSRGKGTLVASSPAQARNRGVKPA